MKNDSVRAMLRALVGGYLIYLAWKLLENRSGGEGDAPPAVAIGAAVLFAVAGVGAIVYAWVLWKKQKDDDGEK